VQKIYAACSTISKRQPYSNENFVYPNVHAFIKLMLTISCTTVPVEHSLLY